MVRIVWQEEEVRGEVLVRGAVLLQHEGLRDVEGGLHGTFRLQELAIQVLSS